MMAVPPRYPARCRARLRGMTLVELLLATAIAGLIGASLAAMLAAVTRGTSDANDARAMAVERPRLAARLGAVLRESRAVLVNDPAGRVLLWVRDSDDDGLPALDELELLTFDAATQTLALTRADPAAAKVIYGWPDDYAGAIDTDVLGGSPVVVTWSDAVTGFRFRTDTDPPLTSRVSYELDLQAGPSPDTLVGTSSLRTEHVP